MKRISLIAISILTIAVALTSCQQGDFNPAESAADYTSEAAAYDENNRKVVKTAQISLQVDELEKSILDLKSFLQPIKGYIYNYEISNPSYEIDHFQKNMDSSVSVQKIAPEGNLSVRIPLSHADSFINYVLESNAQISSLKISDDDITESLWEQKEVADIYSKSSKAQNHKGNSKNIGYDNNTSMSAIRAKALAAKMDYKSKYLWFDMNFSAKPYYQSTTNLAAKNYRTPMHVGLGNALVNGWHICADIILSLVTIWPLILLLLLGLFLYKRYRFTNP